MLFKPKCQKYFHFKISSLFTINVKIIKEKCYILCFYTKPLKPAMYLQPSPALFQTLDSCARLGATLWTVPSAL